MFKSELQMNHSSGFVCQSAKQNTIKSVLTSLLDERGAVECLLTEHQCLKIVLMRAAMFSSRESLIYSADDGLYGV